VIKTKVINIQIIDGIDNVNSNRYFLKKIYDLNLTRGLIIAFAFHFSAILTYYVGAVLLKKEDIRTVKFVDINELYNAPPLQETAPPTAVKIEKTEIIEPTAGIPIIVPDEEAKPDQTFLTQEEIKAQISSPPISMGGEGGEVKVDITQSIEQLARNDEPGIDEFVAVQEYPVVIHKALPEYPDLARKANMEGKVILKGLIDESGNVTKVVFMQGDDIFRDAATGALYNTKFKPAINGGRAVKVWITYPYIFRLKDQ
jgi:protein TonB